MGIAQAQNAAPDDQKTTTPATLTGEWDGVRTSLRDKGIDLSAGYVSEFGANVSGGTRHDATETGQLSFDALLDLQKLVGLSGGTIDANISYRRGKNLTDRAGLGALLQVQEVYGRGQTWRVSEFSYRQQLGGGVDVKIGRLPMGSDFATFSCDFQNLTFCGNPVGNLAGNYWFNYPLSVWGARLRVKHGDWYAMAGVYEDNPNNNRNDFALSHSGAVGVTAPAEIGWTPRLGARGLPGSYRIGSWYNNSRSDDLLNGRDGQPFALTGEDPARSRGRYGGYFMVQQQVSGSFKDGLAGPVTTHGLSVFFNFTQADRRTTRIDSQIATGLFFTGPLSARPSDDLGFAVGRNHVNSRASYAGILALPGLADVASEYTSELYYSVHVRPWLTVRPNIQYIVHPGGFHDATDVVVLGTKSSIAF
jgi:porin